MDVAILGLGRSGLAIAEGALRNGDRPVVFDAKRREALDKPELALRLDELGVELRDGHAGEIPVGFAQLVVNPAVDERSPVLADAVAKGMEVIGEVEFAYRIARAPIVAVTGTNGKSTTVAMTYACLDAAGENPVLCGNIFGSGLPEMTLTEAALRSGPEATLVAEISSFQLEWVRDFRPVAAAITNITPDHLNRYDGFRDYAAAKLRIFAAQGEGDFAVLRSTDPVASLPKGSKATLRTVGPFGQDSEYDEQFLRILDRKIPRAKLPIAGSFNATNAGMAAILADSLQRWRAAQEPEGRAARRLAAALEATRKSVASRRSVYESGLRLPEEALDPAIVDGLLNFRGLTHRMERLDDRNGVRFINNSMCTNPAAVVASVQSLETDAHILLGGKNKELDFGPLKQFLAAGRHRVYAYGADAVEVNRMLGDRWPIYSTMDEAFAAAVRAARPGETVILSPGCASMDGFNDFRERGERFKEMAKEWHS